MCGLESRTFREGDSGVLVRSDGFDETAEMGFVFRINTQKAHAVSETGLHADHLALQVQLGFSQPQRDLKTGALV